METLYLKFRCILSSNYYSHVVTIIHFTIQNGWTALEKASFNGHHKVVELLLGAGANPDLQNKVRTGWDSGVHSNLSNRRWHFMHPVIPRSLDNLPSLLVCLYPGATLSIPHKYWYLSSSKTLPNCSACFHNENSYKFIVY